MSIMTLWFWMLVEGWVSKRLRTPQGSWRGRLPRYYYGAVTLSALNFRLRVKMRTITLTNPFDIHTGGPPWSQCEGEENMMGWGCDKAALWGWDPTAGGFLLLPPLAAPRNFTPHSNHCLGFNCEKLLCGERRKNLDLYSAWRRDWRSLNEHMWRLHALRRHYTALVEV